MKLRLKLQIVASLVTFSATFYLFFCIFNIQRQQRAESHREELTRYMEHIFTLKNASQFLKVGEDTTIISPQFSYGKKYLSVILVQSKSINTLERKTIRETWASLASYQRSLVLFVVPKPTEKADLNALKSESTIYNDLIIDKLEDDITMSSVKALRMLNWYQIKFGESSEFLVQTDDCTFIHLPNLRKHLESITEDEYFSGYIAGKVQSDDEQRFSQHEDSYSQKFVPKSLWPPDFYPEHISSSFVVFSSQVIPYVLNISGNIPLFPLEDVFITGMLVKLTLRLELTELDNVYDEYSLFLYYILWFTGDLESILSFKCNNRWTMINLHKLSRI